MAYGGAEDVAGCVEAGVEEAFGGVDFLDDGGVGGRGG